jgi:hypothetical protein
MQKCTLNSPILFGTMSMVENMVGEKLKHLLVDAIIDQSKACQHGFPWGSCALITISLDINTPGPGHASLTIVIIQTMNKHLDTY